MAKMKKYYSSIQNLGKRVMLPGREEEMITFKGHFFETDDIDLQKLIEGLYLFHEKKIYIWEQDYEPVESKPPKEEPPEVIRGTMTTENRKPKKK